jgi:hypothetical protein
MALRSIQPLTKMRIKNFSEGKKRPARRANKLAAICEPTVQKILGPQPLAFILGHAVA